MARRTRLIRSDRELLLFCLYNKIIAMFIIAKNNFRIYRCRVIEFKPLVLPKKEQSPRTLVFYLRFPRPEFQFLRHKPELFPMYHVHFLEV